MSLENPNKDVEEILDAEQLQSEESDDTAVVEDPYAAFENPEIYTKKELKRSTKLTLVLTAIGATILLVAALVLLVFVFPYQAPVDPNKVIDTAVVLLDKTGAQTTTTTTSAGDTTQSSGITFLNLTTNKTDLITSVTLKQDDGTVEIVNKDGALYVKEFEDVTVHNINMGSLISVLLRTIAIDEIGVQENLADFGLDDPTLIVTVNYSDNTQKVWHIGDLAPDQTGCYMVEAGSNHIYLLGIDQVDALMQSKFSFVSTSVFTAPDVEAASEGATEVVLREMSLSGSLRDNKEFSFRLVTSEDSDAYIYYNYIITKPFLKGANSNYDTQLDAFTYLSATTVIAVDPTEEDKKKYGFDNPYSVMEFTLSKRTTVSKTGADGNVEATTSHEDLETHTLYITEADSDYYYVMIDDRPIIYLVAVADLPLATLQYNQFADSLLFLEDITKLSKVGIKTADSNTMFELSHIANVDDVEKNMTVTAGEKTYDTMDFRYLVNNLMAIERYDALSQDTKGLPLKMELTLYRIDDTQPVLTVQFYEISSSVCAAVLSHGEEYLVKTADVSFAVEQYENYLNGKTVLRK